MAGDSITPPLITRPVTPTRSFASRPGGEDSFDAYARDLSGAASRTRAGGVDVWASYPGVYESLATLQLPTDMVSVLRFCRYLAEMSAVHKAYVQFMSTLPVTDIVLKPKVPVSDPVRRAASTGSNTASGTDVATREIDNLVRRHWRLRKVRQEMARSRFTYSNACAVISYPFRKTLRCTTCGHEAAAIEAEWEIRPGGSFVWKCTSCSRRDIAHVYDRPLPVPEDVRLVVLDMERVTAVKNDFRDTVDVYYEIPEDVIKRLTASRLDKRYVCDTPQAYLEAALGKRHPEFDDDRPRIRLMPGRYYLMRAATLPRGTDGLAFPEFAASFLDYWLYRLHSKSQETIHTELAVPKRMVFPDSGNSGTSIFEIANVSSFMEVLKNELAKMRKDPGRIGVFPFAVGQSTVGGEAKPLDLSTSMKAQVEMQTAALGAPIEALFGGMQFSGASVTLQQVLARFEDHRSDDLDMVEWFIDDVTRNMNMPEYFVELKPFRMGEDVQYVQMMAALREAQLISGDRLRETLNIESESERSRIRDDVMFQAELVRIRGEADSHVQTRLLIQQNQAQAEGMVSGMEADLDAKVELAKKVRGDVELYARVMQDPGLVVMIFGPGSPEAAQVAPAMPMPTEAPVDDGDGDGVGGDGTGMEQPETSAEEAQAYLAAWPGATPDTAAMAGGMGSEAVYAPPGPGA